MSGDVQGTLVVIGGAEDKEGDCLILRRFVELAGGDKARLVVVTAAAAEPQRTGEMYRSLFRSLGVAEVAVLDVGSRRDAGDPAVTGKIKQATGIFFTGGDQLRITSILGGTRMDEALRRAHRSGAVIAGTSAGASAMSETMIVEGEETEPPRKNSVQMAPGMGLLREVVVDQHFAQRGRLGRLLAAVAQHPYMLGVGIDEDTAIVVGPDSTFEVIGSHAVTVVDGRKIEESNVSETGSKEPLALTNVILHILPSGYRFETKKRVPLKAPVHNRDDH
ncbi:cyanophycinase CphB [Thermacetogenium phaeum DSM 12270]|uniref:Cyanophycinase n=1 Tax=Thermacetogenium phaeum (strain ATCC BAA-254 / DSM 26808 / PB) TaxID=1089553 RepID=K4LM07_THEPS|nr:cyanophycinase [Thermacetogenium phaeum]AFV13005.1 cyanophycinase CphB [Thermacetogenium phaeum DSM 12270]MDN5365738.1 cyanophycinase [Thermacetogenium sp.]MDN5376420.1 cyanophycinase [Thermacetogenium sp.]